MPKLSIIIPSRNEEYLDKTIEDIKRNAITDVEILPGDDTDGIGQRAMMNKLAKQVTGDFIMKTDGHCSFSYGFDDILIKDVDENTILAPILMPLDPIAWAINGRKQMSQFVFDRNFVMQHTDGKPGETMCLQGSCWVVSTKNYWGWNVCDETLGSWGGQAVELGIAAWINGGVCKTTGSAYYGHLFRHTNEEFPYDRGDNPGQLATKELQKRYHSDPRILKLAEKFNNPLDWNLP